MAKAYEGILGPVVGKIGPVVGYLWRGKPVFRAYVEHIRYPNTERQQRERDWFITMVRLAAVARQALLLGMRQKAAAAQMTEGNWFVRRNKQHFRHENGTLHVDYERLMLSEGPVAPVTGTSAAVAPDGVLTVNWQKRSGLHREKSSDSVHLYVYNDDEKRGLLAAPAQRRDGRLSLRLPDHWQHHDLHLYLFATDSQGLASPTTYASTSTARDNQEVEPTDNLLEENPEQIQPKQERKPDETAFSPMSPTRFPRGTPATHQNDT